MLVTRDVTESAVIEVEADSKDEAADLSIDIANGTIGSSKEICWETNEIGHAPAYLGDCVEENVHVVDDVARKPKYVLVRVRCARDFVDDVPQVFYREIPEYLVDRIKELSRAVKKYDAYAMEEFHYHGTWSELFLGEEKIDESDWRSKLGKIEEKHSSVEIPELRVTESEFHWTAVPKHADDTFALTTTRIPISFLDSDDEIYMNV